MNKQELRTLKGQLLLLCALFAGSVALAVFIASERAFFEKFIEEKYVALSPSLKPLADSAAEGKLEQEAFNKLSQADRLILYDDWMARPDSLPEETPHALVSADKGLYLARAERTIINGSNYQKLRALKFLELAASRDAIPILRKAREWSLKRRTLELTAKITETLERLERN
jgi:hypothetical protein